MRAKTMGGHNINNMLYTDDIVLIAGNQDGFQNLMDAYCSPLTIRVRIKLKKAEIMVLSRKKDISECYIHVNREILEKVVNTIILDQ